MSLRVQRKKALTTLAIPRLAQDITIVSAKKVDVHLPQGMSATELICRLLYRTTGRMRQAARGSIPSRHCSYNLQALSWEPHRLTALIIDIYFLSKSALSSTSSLHS